MLAVWAVVPDRRECQIANMKPHYRTMLEMQGLRGGLGPAPTPRDVLELRWPCST